MKNPFLLSIISIILLCGMIISVLFIQPQQKRILAFTSNDISIPKQPTCNNSDVLIDKTYGLSASYIPDNLVFLSSYSISVTDSTIKARLDIVGELRSMMQAASSDGVSMSVLSGYRSYTEQSDIHNGFNAPPGHSQHQLGVAIDFTTNDPSYAQTGDFSQTPAGIWLSAHAYEYGFMLAYPKGAENITGYDYEPWHYRYMGIMEASKMKESGLLMEQYLQKYGVLPDC